jgi:NitT/TauT family transport system ATP-binding protein
VLDGIDLDVREGEILCFVGPSGSGKTTLLRVLGGLQNPTAGSLEYRGARMTGPRREIAIVFQDYGRALLPWRTVAGNVSLALEAVGCPKSERADRIAALLARVNLPHVADHFPSMLSGGMQQRVQIARCLAQEPGLLLMDEPFGALDAMTRQNLQDELLNLAAKTGTTVVFITHDLEEAIYLGDRVLALSAHPGRIVASFDVDLPRPRDQLTTRESPAFLRLRRELYAWVEARAS